MMPKLISLRDSRFRNRYQSEEFPVRRAPFINICNSDLSRLSLRCKVFLLEAKDSAHYDSWCQYYCQYGLFTKMLRLSSLTGPAFAVISKMVFSVLQAKNVIPALRRSGTVEVVPYQVGKVKRILTICSIHVLIRARCLRIEITPKLNFITVLKHRDCPSPRKISYS